jgi:hypothetical protein
MSSTIDLNGNVAYRMDHSSTGVGVVEPHQVNGDYEHPDYTFIVENYYDLFSFRGQCWVPQLTMIA